MSGRVADAVVDELARAGVRRIYGVPGGGSNMTLIDAATSRGLRFVLAHQETAAVYMAAAEAEVTGTPGVCLATVGPGVANSVNGLAHCSLDRVPLLLVTDRVDDPLTLHQLVDHRRLVAGVTKRSEVLAPASARETTRRALAAVLAAPRGPVHLDLSAGVAAAPASAAAPSSSAHEPPAPDTAGLEAAAALLAASARPVVLAGLGARDAATSAELRAFARSFGVPALATYKAKGVLPDDDPLAAGLVTNGALEAATLDRADALLLVGFDRVELMPGPWRWPVPAVGIAEPPPPRGPLESTAEVAGDAAGALRALCETLRRRGWQPAWRADGWTAPAIVPPAPRSGAGIAPSDLVAACRRLAPPATIATVDAGSHMFAATLFWKAHEPRRFLISNGLATMGYGLPAAIGAALCQEHPVVCFTGDGGLAMAAGELATAARLGVRVVVVVFNDGSLNLIKVKQERQGKTTEGLDFAPVDWAAVARGMGLRAFAVAETAGLEDALTAAFAAETPALVDARVDAGTYADLLRLMRG